MPLEYPEAKRLDIVEDLHGHLVADPYRWLEDADAPETEAWSAAQDALVRAVLDPLPGRDRLRQRLEALLPGTISLPVVVGGRTFFTRRLQDQEHAVLFVREAGDERVLVDPNAMADDATTVLEAWHPSWEGDLLAFQVSEHGRESKTLRVIDVATGALVEGPLPVGRWCPVAWEPGGAAYHYVRPVEGEEFHRRLWRHEVGAPQDADALVFGEGLDPTAYISVSSSPDGRWLTVAVALGTAPRNDVYVRDLHDAGGRFVPVHEGVDAQSFGSVQRDGLLYLHTDLDAPRGRFVVADPAAPGPAGWRTLLPEADTVLEQAVVTDAAIVAVRTRDVVAEVTVHDRETGAPTGRIALPGLGVAHLQTAEDGGDELWVAYGDHVTPMRVLTTTLPDTELEPWADPPGAVTLDGVETRQLWCTSADGTRVPMFVLAQGGREVGPRPTILYGYGGFGVTLPPEYSAYAAAWVEAGGVYVVANLRGGTEYGEEWHRAGMRGEKQHVFDDFIAAAEHLVAEGWTSTDRLAIAGGSNGGLLVGAALTQRPDLFAAVVCSAPLLDMVRYERFGLGVTWNDEYGTAEDPTELGWLLSYSPYHRVVEGTAYPATLFTVFDGDTRVDPLHARKLCAALQHATASPPDERPILIRRESGVGHSTRARSRTIGLQVDTMSFLAAQTGLRLAD